MIVKIKEQIRKEKEKRDSPLPSFEEINLMSKKEQE